jgi:hypothetical protein
MTKSALTPHTPHVSVAGAKEMIAHTHTNGFLMVSDEADILQLAKSGQTTTYLIGPAGELVRCSSESAQWVDDVIHEIIRGGKNVKVAGNA